MTTMARRPEKSAFEYPYRSPWTFFDLATNSSVVRPSVFIKFPSRDISIGSHTNSIENTMATQASKTKNVQARTGNKTEVMFGGVPVGLVQSIRCSDDYSPEPASGIGSISVVEYVPTMARHTISVQHMILYTKTLRDLGISVENGADAIKGMVFDIVTTNDGVAMRTYTGCSFASGELDIQAHKILSASAQFNALDVTGTVA